MRLDTIDSSTGRRYNIDSVSVDGCSGELDYGGFLLGHGGGAYPESIKGLKISNCNFIAPAILEIGANFGNVVLDSVALTPKLATQYPGFALARSSAYSAGCTYAGSSLAINNCTIQQKGSSAVPAVVIENGSSIDNVTFNGFAVKNASNGYLTPLLIDIEEGSIDQLVVNSVDSGDIKEPVSPGGFADVEVVSGSGVLATGWKFPDEVMADGVPYISANSGLPSIKVGGIVEPYSG
jgi:hypothetical protein